jgi:breast cancer 2 susceptibility protein
MKDRYEKELCRAKRPSVRKILNRDVSACVPVILCVSQILRFRSNDPKTGTTKEEVRLELTDGWYALPASPDNVLLQFIERKKIKVGSKLMICNGQLLGFDDGLDPLDDGYSSTKRDCPLCLSISANSTRLARWDAKLGFVSPNNPQLHRGTTLLVTSLCDVFTNGGPIPAIDLVVCKRYPRMFLEQVNSTGRQEESLHLTEAENAARQLEHDTRHQRSSEKFADKVHKECSEVILTAIYLHHYL